MTLPNSIHCRFTVAGKMQKEERKTSSVMIETNTEKVFEKKESPVTSKRQTKQDEEDDKGKRYLDVSNRVKRPPRLRSYKGGPVSPSASKRPMSTPVSATEASNQVLGSRALSVPSSITEEVDISAANDSGLERFFGPATTSSEVSTDVTEADLDDVVFTDRMLRSAKGRRVVKGPAGRRKARNPVKSLQARTDLRDSYSQVGNTTLLDQHSMIVTISVVLNELVPTFTTSAILFQVMTSVAEDELNPTPSRRSQTSNNKQSHLAAEALQG